MRRHPQIQRIVFAMHVSGVLPIYNIPVLNHLALFPADTGSRKCVTASQSEASRLLESLMPGMNGKLAVFPVKVREYPFAVDDDPTEEFSRA